MKHVRLREMFYPATLCVDIKHLPAALHPAFLPEYALNVVADLFEIVRRQSKYSRSSSGKTHPEQTWM